MPVTMMTRRKHRDSLIGLLFIRDPYHWILRVEMCEGYVWVAGARGKM